ncbi:sulfatase maturase [Sediminicola sp. YIK13]|uniref:ergothioneine biosynthesis protein EgtB n=1 Tax=Sediminicola sp. YIK13 TaxID=1453352 RepID=UPI0007208AD9|nr:ergothioneine biosynthesis protein EgtB [Sediminicola sp. YIK13]ALM08973.1 sulfatase maturase [Sediminicola sp. YIK13]
MILTQTLLDFFIETRKHTESICAPLEIEDYVVQPMADVSPPKWHLGHSTWFFEEFILKKYKKGYRVFDTDFSFVFNSYYESLGERVVRSDRGNLSRPSVEKVYEYRNHVTAAVVSLFEEPVDLELEAVMEIGIHHEKQHQELLLTDIKYILGNNPLLPPYANTYSEHRQESESREWIELDEGIYEIGHNSNQFCYDNELGRHKVYLHPFQISSTLVTNKEYLKFMNAGGYEHFEYWHAEGWDWVNTNLIKAPLYWHQVDGSWQYYSLKGLQKIDPKAPVTHLSYYEAFAFAQWKGSRLPTEFEWEAAQAQFSWGKRWEWTESAYLPYPNYQKAEGALGEYNGKFMVNQKVLRGGSIATPNKHTRPTYRNFFPPSARWQYTGLRLAK